MEDQIKHHENIESKNTIQTNENIDNHGLSFPSNDTLVAGFKVRNKAGGPELLVVGFIQFYPDGPVISYGAGVIHYGYPLNPEKIKGSLEVYPKVKLNAKGLQGREFGYCYDEHIFTYWYYNNTAGYLKPSEGSDQLYFVCKRWSDKTEEFVYEIMNTHEIEMVSHI